MVKGRFQDRLIQKLEDENIKLFSIFYADKIMRLWALYRQATDVELCLKEVLNSMGVDFLCYLNS